MINCITTSSGEGIDLSHLLFLQVVQQYPRLFQIFGVEAFGEPVVHGLQFGQRLSAVSLLDDPLR